MKFTFRTFLIASLIVMILGASALGAYIAWPPPGSKKSTEFFDVQTVESPVSYVYAPGIFATEMLMARYNPDFIAVTGERVRCASGGYVIDEPHEAVVFPEIDLRKPGHFTLNPITWFSNRVRNDLFPLIARVFQDNFDVTVDDNPNSKHSVINYGFDFWNANHAQAKDIKALKETIKKQREEYPDNAIILFGDSRGADTIFSYLAEEEPTFVKAAVLEGLTDDIAHQVKHLIYSDKEERTENRLYDLMTGMMFSYKKNGINPRKTVEYISDDVPLLLVISMKDGLVHPQGVFYVYRRLKERGHTKVHLLLLNKAAHPLYMITAEDKEFYETVVHAFYKHYNLPHNSTKAAQGYQAFSRTQPLLEELKQYQLPSCPLC